MESNIYDKKEDIDNQLKFHDLSVEMHESSSKTTIEEKCGDIIRTYDDDCNKQTFSFLCTLCGVLFEEYIVFTTHITESHIVQPTIKNEQINDILEETPIKIEPIQNQEITIEELNFTAIYVNEDLSKDRTGIVEKDVNLKSNTRKPRNRQMEKTESDKEDVVSKPKSKKSRQKVTMFCDICGEEFYSQNLLGSHMKYDHIPTKPFVQITTLADDGGEDKKDKEKPKNLETNKQKNYDPFACRYCGERFNKRLLRFEHECLHTGEKTFKCEVCDKNFRKQISLILHSRIHNGRNFKCETCDKSFIDKTKLAYHIRRHTGDKRYKCEYCDKTFINNTGKRHHEKTHTGEKPHQCAECGKHFYTSTLLKVHKRIHTGERPFKCSICIKTFIDNVARKRHEKTHTGDKLYKCDYCEKKCITSSAKRVHERIHTGEKPYQCAECGEKFYSGSALNRHERKHTGEKPYKCNYCGKTFTENGTRQRHEKIHTGEKPFSCDVCNSKFAIKKGLAQHKKIHSNVNSYHCKICGKGFKQNSGLYCHMKSHKIEKFQ